MHLAVGRVRHHARGTTTVLVTTVTAVLLAGCALALPPGGESSGAYSPHVVRVVAAEDFWGSIVAQIGGTHAQVVSLIASPDTDPHAYEPTASDARRLADAQVAIYNGAGYDPWMPRLLAADGGSRTVLDVASLVGVPTGGNPHLWYSPAFVNRFVTTATADLIAADPVDRAYFQARARAYADVGLSSYHSTIASIRARFARTPVAASESIVVYLCSALSLRLVTPPTFLRAVSEGTDPSAADIAAIDVQLRNHKVHAYLENTQNLTPDVQAQVLTARSAGIPIVRFTETLHPAGVTFQAWQTVQLRALEAALASVHG